MGVCMSVVLLFVLFLLLPAQIDEGDPPTLPEVLVCKGWWWISWRQ